MSVLRMLSINLKQIIHILHFWCQYWESCRSTLNKSYTFYIFTAAAQGHVHVLQWLIESGIDLTVRNSQGKRAVDVARRYGNKSCVKVLGGNPGTCIDKSLLLCYFFVVVALTVSVLHGHHFFHPRHNGQWPPTLKDFLYQILSITFFSYLNRKK